MLVLEKISIAKKLAAITLVPIIAILAFEYDLIQRQSTHVNSSANTLKVIELSLALDNVAHQHAVERGLTAGFLGSEGSQGKDKLLSQRSVADDAEVALQEIISKHQKLLATIGIDAKNLKKSFSQKQWC